jgi:hypothetical protein
LFSCFVGCLCQINQQAVFLLPPEMMQLYKPNIIFITDHAVDPDKRRYAIPEEAPRHYIDIDHYGKYPYDSLPRKWEDAVKKYSADTLNTYGIVPWWLQTMMHRLTNAFKEKNQVKILRYSAELGHYIADAHVPLHACSNHNGQYSNQKGIHGFWESRIPELLAETDWDLFIGKASYIKKPAGFFFSEKNTEVPLLPIPFTNGKRTQPLFSNRPEICFEERNGIIIRQYSTAFSLAYDKRLKGMIGEKNAAIDFAIASAGTPPWSMPTTQSGTTQSYRTQRSRFAGI